MNTLCLMPTYGKPQWLINSAIQMFLMQTHEKRILLVYDDQGRMEGVEGGANVVIMCQKQREPNLSCKYATMLDVAERIGIEWDAVVIWDDDDVYTPWHIESRVTAMNRTGRDWTHPSTIFSTYGGSLHIEPNTAGRFHGSIAFNKKAYEAVGGWQHNPNPDFDLRLIGRLLDHGLPADPNNFTPGRFPSYVYRWDRINAIHSSAFGGHPLGWQKAIEQHAVTTKIGQLKPELDKDARRTFSEFHDFAYGQLVDVSDDDKLELESLRQVLEHSPDVVPVTSTDEPERLV